MRIRTVRNRPGLLFVALFHMHPVNRFNYSLHILLAIDEQWTYTHKPLCGKSHSFHLDTDRSALTLRTFPAAKTFLLLAFYWNFIRFRCFTCGRFGFAIKCLRCFLSIFSCFAYATNWPQQWPINCVCLLSLYVYIEAESCQEY